MESGHVQRETVTPPHHHAVGIRVQQKTLLYIHRAMLVAALIGLFTSVYLFITYVSGAPIACGALQGCEIVRASKWAYTFGLPRPFIGVLFYIGIIGLLAFRAYAPAYRPKWWRWALIVIAAIGFVESGFLTVVQWLDIRAFCVWCITSAIAATSIFLLSFFDGHEPRAPGVVINELKFIFSAFATTIVVGAIALHLLLGGTLGGYTISITR